MRRWRGSSSPPSDTTNTQVAAFSDPENRPFGHTVVTRSRIGARWGVAKALLAGLLVIP